MTEGISMADRIIVLSKRPGQIELDFQVDFKDFGENLPPLKRRETTKFREYFNLIWKELDLDG